MGSYYKSEVRQLTEGVYVRFNEADLAELQHEADRLSAASGRKISVPELLRNSALDQVRGRRSVPTA